LFDCGAVTREAVMDPHLARCRAKKLFVEVRR
jgi:hypothetical protein